MQHERHPADIISVSDYYGMTESRLGYKILLRGVRHFGFYPRTDKRPRYLSMAAAQRLMEDKLGEALNLPPNSRVLDAGCGEGAAAIHLANRYNLQVEGVDLLDVSVKAARRRAHRRGAADQTHFQVMDYSRLSFSDNSFAGAYTMETLVHAVDFRKALKEVFRVLAPGGVVALFEYTVKPQSEMSDREREIFRRVTRASAMHSFGSFTHGSFPGILRQEGFIEVRVSDISENVAPMVKRLAFIACPTYLLTGLLGIRNHFVNAAAAVEFYEISNCFRYNIVTARKPLEVLNG